MFARQPSSTFQVGSAGYVLASLSAGCSNVAAGEFREDVRVTIAAIAECLKDSNSDVCKATIELLSRLAAQGMC